MNHHLISKIKEKIQMFIRFHLHIIKHSKQTEPSKGHNGADSVNFMEKRRGQ